MTAFIITILMYFEIFSPPSSTATPPKKKACMSTSVNFSLTPCVSRGPSMIICLALH